MGQRPDFREAKQTYRQLYKEHVESTSEGNSSIHPADQTRQSHRQRLKDFEENNFVVHPRNGWKYYPLTNSSSSVHWQHDDWKSNQWSNQRWDYWRSSTWTEQYFFVELH